MYVCDDFLLLSPTRNGLQNLLHLCEKYAEEHNISFSTNPDPSKSKSKINFLLVDVQQKVVLIIRNCPGSVRLTILVISFMNQVHKI